MIDYIKQQEDVIINIRKKIKQTFIENTLNLNYHEGKQLYLNSNHISDLFYLYEIQETKEETTKNTSL